MFKLQYDAQYPDPPKISLDAAIARWKISNTTQNVPNPIPTLDDSSRVGLGFGYDIRNMMI